MPSFTVPSQSLSSVSQISGCGLLLQAPKPLGTPGPTQPPTPTDTPLLKQTLKPAQLAGGVKPQGMSATPSSATPSQSLSQPSQISALGVQPPGQMLNGTALPGALSTIASQSSSWPLQVSAN